MNPLNPLEPLFININKFQYTNKDAAEKLIRYISRTRPGEIRAQELLSYGFSHGVTYQKPIEEIIKEFEYVQKMYNAAGCLMCHYVILISKELFARMDNNLNRLNSYAVMCCSYLFQMGHQACFAVHYLKEEGHLHIHLAINDINYMTGKHLRQYPAEIKKNVEIPLRNMIQHFLAPDPIGVMSLDEM